MSSSDRQDIDRFLHTDGLERAREREIGQSWGYRYDVNLLPDHARLTPFLRNYMEIMGWDDLIWLEDVHMGYEEGRAAVFAPNPHGWIPVPANISLPDNQQDRDMLARELLIKFQMSKRNPLIALNSTHTKG